MCGKLLLTLFIPILFFGQIFDSPPSKMYLHFEEGILDYRRAREALTEKEIDGLLDRGKRLIENTEIVATLVNGGSALFPHASILKCGDQIAAVVQAALEAARLSGKKKVLVLGVLHSLSEQIAEWRYKEIRGESVLESPCRGIFGPDLPNAIILKREYSLDNFLFLMEQAIQRSSPIEIIVRFPNHVSGQPETLEGIEELRQLTKESIVVGTADLRHYGVNYGIPKETALPISQQALEIAQGEIQSGMDLLKSENLIEFRQYCYRTVNDAFEVGQLLRALLGPLESQIHDLRLVDVSDLFVGRPQPNWVATGIVDLRVMNSHQKQIDL